MLYLLAEHPEAYQRVADEQRALPESLPDMEKLLALEYTGLVVNEAMRLYPPAWVISRRQVADDELAGQTTKAGSTLFLSPYMLHHKAQYWENPESFDPERFGKERFGPVQQRAFIPFGAGMRKCIGVRFAQIEIMLVIFKIFQRFDFELTPGPKVEPEFSSTLKPKNGLHLRLRARS
ncbi:MAG: cytochrome P450 [Cytophagales bacterium]|nr:cytochrome P450 [Cytophagales bacterium]